MYFAAEPKPGVIGLAEIIVNGLRDADNADGTADAFSVLGQL